MGMPFEKLKIIKNIALVIVPSLPLSEHVPQSVRDWR